MAINIEKDELLPISELGAWLELQAGVSPVRSTIYRWYTHGIDGIRLETIAIGRKRFTTVCALQRFVAYRHARLSNSTPNKQGHSK